MTVREDNQELMQKRIDDWKAEIEQIKADTGKIETDARANYDKIRQLLSLNPDDR